MKKFFVAVLVAALSGCASVQMASLDRDADVKKFAPVAGKAQVYVCRDGLLFGSGSRPDIELDGRTISAIAINTFVYQEIEPGDHVVTAKSFGHDSIFDFTAKAGEQRFFQVWPSFGAMIIDEIRPGSGKVCVRSGKLLEQMAKNQPSTTIDR